MVLSVVIPTRNRRARLERALASVQTQEGVELEIVVVDDASNDGTPTMLERAARDDPRITVVRNEERLGGAGARNSGIDVATGEFVAFLDDDDVWLPRKSRRQLEFLEGRPEVGAVSCHHELVDPARTAVPLTYRGPEAITAADLLWDNFPGGASFCVARRSVLDEGVRFDEEFVSCQDWDLWVGLARHAPIGVVPEVLCRYVAHEDDRITASTRARVEGRASIMAKYGDDMTDRCRSYNEVRLRLLTARGRGPRAVREVLTSGSPAVWWIVARSSIAGRRGWRNGDPGRGSRRLHELIRTT